MKLLFAMEGRPLTTYEVRSANLARFRHEIVHYLLFEYNDNIIFKLSLLLVIKERGFAQSNGMDLGLDGYV